VTANKRFSHGLQFNASYTLSKSIDYNSRNTQGIVLQDSTNPRGSRGPSDFDARHRFVIGYLYELPLHGNRLVEGWALSGSTSLQSGNPETITLSGVSPLTNVAATVRPNVVGNPTVSTQDPAHFFNPLAFARPAAGQFGNLGRNGLVTGPGFNNFDFSIRKRTRITERYQIEFRTEVFNIFNHPNFGQPGGSCSPSSVAFNVASIPSQTFPAGTCVPNASFGTITDASGTATNGTKIDSTAFGKIQNTRSAAGDSGSARQVQFALKFIF